MIHHFPTLPTLAVYKRKNAKKTKPRKSFHLLWIIVVMLSLSTATCRSRNKAGWTSYEIGQSVLAIAMDPSGQVWVANDLMIKPVGGDDDLAFRLSPPDTGMYTYISDVTA